MRFFFQVSYISIACLLVLSSCFKKEEFLNVSVPDWTPSGAAPIVNSTMTIQNIVDTKEVNVIEDPNGLFTFVYKDTVASPTAGEIIQVPNQNARFAIGVTPVETTPFPSGQSVTKNLTKTFTANLNYGANLKYIDLKQGTFTLSLSSKFKHNVNLTLTFNSLKSGGVPLVRNYAMNYAGTVPLAVVDNIDLAGYRLDLTGDGSETNSFDYSVSCTITSTGNTITTLDSLNATIDLKSLKYSVMFGDVGVFPISPYTGSLSIDVFDKTVIGDIYFEDPRINLTFDNSFGVPVSFTVNTLEAITTENDVIPITSTALAGPVALNYPSSNEIGQSETTLIALNKDNSNIRDALNPAPNKINYSLQTTIGSTGGTDEFITDKSQIKVYVEVQIPLDGRIHVYALQDTMAVEFPESEYVEKAVLKIKNTNSFPIDILLQGYFLDSNDAVIDSLISPPDYFVTSGQIDNTGKVVSPSEKYTEIAMTKERYEKISKAKKVIIKGELLTTNNASVSVKIYSSNNLQTQISLLADFKVKIQ